MRVALDATPLTLSSGGLTRYTAELSRALAAEHERDDFFLLSDQPFEMPSASATNLRAGRSPQSWLDRKWWLAGLNREMDEQRMASRREPRSQPDALVDRPGDCDDDSDGE